jgi:hypothetical protein
MHPRGKTVKTIVIDKSALVAAPGGLLSTLHCAFLLTDTLLFEIGTEKLGRDRNLSVAEESRANGRIRATLKKAMEEAGNTWIERESALRWELESGESAAVENAPRFNLHDTALPLILSCSSGLYAQCMEYEVPIGRLASTAHAPSDEEYFQCVRRLKERELFDLLRRDHCSPEGRIRIAKVAKEAIGQRAKERGYQVVPSFDPGPGWLAFGMVLSKTVFLPWKFWRYGDEPADRDKPANPWFDMHYIAYMAIADGLLSADMKQLKLAWACWPEKESSIYSLDTQDHTISQFRPEWSQ